MPKKKYNKPIFIGKWTDDFDFNSIKYISYDNKNIKYTAYSCDTNNNIKNDLFCSEKIKNMRKAASIHKQVRKYAQSIIKPGVKIFDICENIDSKIVELYGKNTLEDGIGFPVGLSINDCAAHDSAVPNDKRIVTNEDVIKIDFGTHTNGNIIDSAFTVAFRPKYKPLLESTYEATWNAIKQAGVDAYIDDISKDIQETIESYEIELNNKIYPIKALTNLGGHTIEPYKIHAGNLLLNGLISPTNKRMKLGECWAIETFATTGNYNFVVNGTDEVSHYMLNSSAEPQKLLLKSSKNILMYIKNNRLTLPFCTRWLEKNSIENYRGGLIELEKKNIIKSYPPLMSIKDSYTSQFEHTIYLHEFGKEVLSYGDDY